MDSSTTVILAVNQMSLAKLMQSEEAARSMLAALAFLVWDVLISIDDEVSSKRMTDMPVQRIPTCFPGCVYLDVGEDAMKSLPVY